MPEVLRRRQLPSVSPNRRLVPHIPIPDDLPGIRGLVAFRPETGRSLTQLAELTDEALSARTERRSDGEFFAADQRPRQQQISQVCAGNQEDAQRTGRKRDEHGSQS